MSPGDKTGGLLQRIVVDRPAAQAALAIGGAWAALVVVVWRDTEQMEEFILMALICLVPIILGFAVASRSRPMPRRTRVEHAKLLGLTVAIGVGFGAANLVSNYLMALIDPSIREMLVQRFARIRVVSAMIDAPATEEIAFRLVLFSCLAWLAGKSMKRPGAAFATALVISSIVFGVMHILRPMPLDAELALAYKTGVAVKSSVLGAGFGWVYWRWGLPYSMLCHSLANGAHAVLEPLLF